MLVEDANGNKLQIKSTGTGASGDEIVTTQRVFVGETTKLLGTVATPTTANDFQPLVEYPCDRIEVTNVGSATVTIREKVGGIGGGNPILPGQTLPLTCANANEFEIRTTNQVAPIASQLVSLVGVTLAN